MASSDDAAFHAQLEAGADCLAREAAGPAGRDTHRRLAMVCRERAREAGGPVRPGPGFQS
jgi:hypothetical protein